MQPLDKSFLVSGDPNSLTKKSVRCYTKYMIETKCFDL